MYGRCSSSPHADHPPGEPTATASILTTPVGVAMSHNSNSPDVSFPSPAVPDEVCALSLTGSCREGSSAWCIDEKTEAPFLPRPVTRRDLADLPPHRRPQREVHHVGLPLDRPLAPPHRLQSSEQRSQTRQVRRVTDATGAPSNALTIGRNVPWQAEIEVPRSSAVQRGSSNQATWAPR